MLKGGAERIQGYFPMSICRNCCCADSNPFWLSKKGLRCLMEAAEVIVMLLQVQQEPPSYCSCHPWNHSKHKPDVMCPSLHK